MYIYICFDLATTLARLVFFHFHNNFSDMFVTVEEHKLFLGERSKKRKLYEITTWPLLLRKIILDQSQTSFLKVPAAIFFLFAF